MKYTVWFTEQSIQEHILDLLDDAAVFGVDLGDSEPSDFFCIESQPVLETEHRLSIYDCCNLDMIVDDPFCDNLVSEMFRGMGEDGYCLKVLGVCYGKNGNNNIIAELVEDFFSYEIEY